MEKTAHRALRARPHNGRRRRRGLEARPQLDLPPPAAAVAAVELHLSSLVRRCEADTESCELWARFLRRHQVATAAAAPIAAAAVVGVQVEEGEGGGEGGGRVYAERTRHSESSEGLVAPVVPLARLRYGLAVYTPRDYEEESEERCNSDNNGRRSTDDDGGGGERRSHRPSFGSRSGDGTSEGRGLRRWLRRPPMQPPPSPPSPPRRRRRLPVRSITVLS